VAGTIYEAIHYTVLSNFLLLSAIKVHQLISITSVPKPSLQSFFNVTDQVSHSHLWKYYKNTHTVYISTVMFSESSKESKIFWICSEHYCKL